MTDAALMETKAITRRGLSKRLRRALTLLATEKVSTQQDAAQKSGLSPEHLSRALRRADVQAYMQQMIEARLKQGAVRASHRLLELLDAGSEHVSLDASKLALGIAGFKPADAPIIVNNTMIMPGYVVDLSPVVDVMPTATVED